MPRKKTEQVTDFPYHIYNRVLSQKHYPRHLNERIWQIYCDELCVMSWAYNAKVHLFVLMSNHYHLIVETPDANIADALMHFQREVSKQIKALTLSQDYRFETRYKWKLISNLVQYENVYRYVAQNAVEAKICTDPTDYPYSTLHGQFGNAVLRCPIFELSTFSALLPACMNERHEWLRCQV